MQSEYITQTEQTKRRNKTIATWIISVLVIAGGVWGVILMARSSSETLKTAGQVPAIGASDKVRGNAQAKAVLIEYADYQCPACQSVDPLLKQLLTDYPDKLALVYRNFPLIQIHSTAVAAAAAAEAADKQGKFWEMHDLIFANQTQWADKDSAGDIFTAFAQNLGLDVQKFTSDMNSPEIINKINADYEEAGRLKLDHTPTFAINGKIVANPTSYEGYKQLIDEALK